MKSTIAVLTTCLIAMVLLAGCKEGGSSGNSAINSPFTDSGVSGGSSSSDIGGTGHVPEPATMALLGSGLLAYALFRRNKRKK